MGTGLWIAVTIVLVGGAYALRQFMHAAADRREVSRTAQALLARASTGPSTYEPSMVAGLPEPAQRFFNFAIRPGSIVHTVAEIDMDGELSLGTKEKPGYMPMHAHQVLAAPHGFTWDVTAAKGWMRITGSDGLIDDRSWTRFRLLGMLPAVRVGNDPDHLQSAFGRLVAEAAFWTPGFLLPRQGVVCHWSIVTLCVQRSRTIRWFRVSKSTSIPQGSRGGSVSPDGAMQIRTRFIVSSRLAETFRISGRSPVSECHSR